MSLKLEDIKLGDVVRLRNGETIVVDSRVTSYFDAEGQHFGPFLFAKPNDKFLLADVVDVVERNPRVCVYCGDGVTSKNPECDFCRGCFYSGRMLEDRHSIVLDEIRAIAGVESVDVWHTGGGCMMVAIRLVDGRFMAATDGDASLPEVGGEWDYVCLAETEDAFHEYDPEPAEINHGPVAYRDLPKLIKEAI